MKTIEKVDYSIAYPMAVFGTLRKNECNNHLMNNGNFHDWKIGFLPNFYCKSIWLNYRKGSSAPFEIFFYSQDEWNKIIKRVDRLEGFSPESKNNVGYLRTLVYIHILPSDYKNFPSLSTRVRDLQIPENQWNDFEKIPCWVYSNDEANSQCNGYPVINW